MDGEDVQLLQPEEVRQKMAAGDTFVLNVVTDWCPDCSMRQHPNLPGFVDRLAGDGLQVFQLTVAVEVMSEHDLAALADRFIVRAQQHPICTRSRRPA